MNFMIQRWWRRAVNLRCNDAYLGVEYDKQLWVALLIELRF
jgi:hypothetical protein